MGLSTSPLNIVIILPDKVTVIKSEVRSRKKVDSTIDKEENRTLTEYFLKLIKFFN